MNIDERLQTLTMNLELSIRDHEDTKRRVAALLTNTEVLLKAVTQDAENIRSLVRIAEAHEHGSEA